ncbi:lectin 3 [Penaeus vannamei]|uniref:Lectin 3 n=1 Tax=Penaeus vannamei TaxID=6689 RepID=A0A3R7MTG0_PENVA|nr:lectin 3 [Penaeus vannamei]
MNRLFRAQEVPRPPQTRGAFRRCQSASVPLAALLEMRLVAVCLWLVAGTVVSLENGGGILHEEHFPPLHLNCSQSLTDLILLRQEIQLKELKEEEKASAGILREMADILTDIKNTLRQNRTSGVSCPDNFMNFGDTCLYLAKDKDVNWETARVYCQGLGGDLAVFRDANAYADALGYVKASGIDGSSDVWVGANDLSLEGEWKWVTGEDMPRGTPFWGHHNNNREPTGGASQNCGFLKGNDGFLIHDAPCDWKRNPLCQKKHDQGHGVPLGMASPDTHLHSPSAERSLPPAHTLAVGGRPGGQRGGGSSAS